MKYYSYVDYETDPSIDSIVRTLIEGVGVLVGVDV